MNTENYLSNISNKEFDDEIVYNDDIFRFTEIKQINPIPTNCIVYKTVTGIGATHAEIISKRNSIIVFPHISIVTNKHSYYAGEGTNTFPVYGKITYQAIVEYLFSDNEFAKFLTTPKGVSKIVKILEKVQEAYPQIQYKAQFFILIDECHKIIQEADYRKDMVEVMEHFFYFDNKAMISATPIPPSDPRFVKNGFRHLKVRPQTIRKIPLELKHVNSLINGLGTYFEQNESLCYCIFFNSIVGINSLINQLKLQDYKIFCSRESVEIQTLQGHKNVYYEVTDLTRFNFFTSSFFNGLDIHSSIKPNIVILTDYGFKSHTLIDPYIDTLQIIGRFRKEFLDDIPYKKVTHINNTNAFTNPISEKDALENISVSGTVYNHIKTLKLSLNGTSYRELFDQALKTVTPYSRLIKYDGELCNYLRDNYLDDERVKNYYANASALLTAYCSTQFYIVENDRTIYEKHEIIKLQNKSLRYSKDINIKMTNSLLQLEDYLGLDIYYEQEQKIAQLSYVIYKAYKILGHQAIKAFDYSKNKIEKELLKLDIEKGKNSLPVIDVLHRHFQLNKSYTWKYIKEEVQKLFHDYKIKCIAKAKDIERYFEFVSKKEGENRVYVFTGYKLSAIIQQKHI